MTNVLGPFALDTVYWDDWQQFMRRLTAACADLILTDMPYGTTACSWDTVIDLNAWWVEAHRVAKPRAAIVCTGSQPFTSRLVMSNAARFKYAWVWVKTRPSDHINAKNKPLKKHEDILVFSSGTIANKSPNLMVYYPQDLIEVNKFTYRPNRDTKLSHILGTRPSHQKTLFQQYENYPDDVLVFANPNNDILHPTQKPVALFEYLIRTYTQPGDLVLDPFVGSGTTALAARNTGRRFLCCDLSLAYVLTARQRLAEPYTPDMFETLLPPAATPQPVQAALWEAAG